jgi:hypothetical protein
MIGEGEPSGADAPSKLAEAAEAVNAAKETVQKTTRRVADAIEAGRRPGKPLDLLSEWARTAPLHSLAIAFLLGFTIARRR